MVTSDGFIFRGAVKVRVYNECLLPSNRAQWEDGPQPNGTCLIETRARPLNRASSEGQRQTGVPLEMQYGVFGHRSVREADERRRPRGNGWTREGVDGQERSALFGLGREPDLPGGT
ncbi:hypothetical protein L210DRAFT_3510233 [Boletus edulis BED1]|uniref:Uncharacterized protein n=1 Tax=Boletus edulis BED1 TaxID=1328754 RepID=A0AAD4G732_BOLED|nr:hypothetical protein L210DRAFT_3510233 [Boletus edulis BED1]